MAVETFSIQTPESELEALRTKLRLGRWPSASPWNDWRQGTSLPHLRDLIDYWNHGFSWRMQEARLNRLAQFRAAVGGLALHFVHEKGHGPAPLPLLLIHGWPSSFAEMSDIIPKLTEPERWGADRHDSFDVVVPSLPGYGYSEIPHMPGMSIWRAADLLQQLMTDTLGYERFVVAGGDWGAYAASYLGYHYPKQVMAVHLSFVPGGLSPAIAAGQAPHSPAEQRLLLARERWDREEGGYEHLQATKPQTLAYALTDSPQGLAGWILEKMHAWTDCDDRVVSALSRDWLLTNISIYWFTQTIASSMRLYQETRMHPWALPPGARIESPTGVASFPKELSIAPREWAERIYNVQHWTDMPRGGHFAAAEQPDLLAGDLRTFLRRFRQ